ncbi:MAG: SDR family oxidoreductase [Flavobacteriales bacterium]|nr:SDR family oxidoreductase [Flavobacteriales bacterium]
MDLVTGGTGIVGAHVLLELTLTGDPVRALVRSNSDRAILTRIFKHYQPDKVDELLSRINWFEGDLNSPGALEEAMVGAKNVYHAAAMVSFDTRDAQTMQKVNVEGTASVVNAALVVGIERLCFVSSIAAIGEAPGHVERDETLPWSADEFTSAYALSKYEAELEIQRGIAEGLDAVIVNPCMIIGPGAPGKSTMTLIERLSKGSRFHPPGSNAYVDARDVAQCMIKLMDQAPTGERYLLVGENLTYKEFFTQFCKANNEPAPTRELEPWMLALAWRAERLRTFFTRTRPMVTKATVHSAIIERRYSNKKLVELTGHQFRPIEEAVANVVKYLRSEKDRIER